MHVKAKLCLPKLGFEPRARIALISAAPKLKLSISTLKWFHGKRSRSLAAMQYRTKTLVWPAKHKVTKSWHYIPNCMMNSQALSIKTNFISSFQIGIRQLSMKRAFKSVDKMSERRSNATRTTRRLTATLMSVIGVVCLLSSDVVDASTSENVYTTSSYNQLVTSSTLRYVYVRSLDFWSDDITKWSQVHYMYSMLGSILLASCPTRFNQSKQSNNLKSLALKGTWPDLD